MVGSPKVVPALATKKKRSRSPVPGPDLDLGWGDKGEVHTKAVHAWRCMRGPNGRSTLNRCMRDRTNPRHN